MLGLPRRSLVLALVLASGSLAPALVHADEPAKRLSVPKAPSSELAETLAAVTSAMSPELHASFVAVVADANVRLQANERAVAKGEGERLSVDDACRAALLAADFGDVSKRKGKVIDALVSFAVLQLAFDLHDTVRERTGRQLAIRAVRACKGAVACLDAITPTAEMPAGQVTAVRKQFDGKGKDLEAADRLGNFEIQMLSMSYETTVARVKTSDKQMKAVMDFVRG